MIDYIVLTSSLVFAFGFMLLGVHRVFNFYLGVVLGFFIFLSLNLQLKLMLIDSGSVFTIFEFFIFNHKEIFLFQAILLIPVLGVLFSILTCKSKKSYLASALFGSLIPIFFIGLVVFIWKTISVHIPLIDIISDIFIDSKIFDLFYNNLSLFFILLTFLLFGKLFYYISKVMIYLSIDLVRQFKDWILNKKEERLVKRFRAENQIKK